MFAKINIFRLLNNYYTLFLCQKMENNGEIPRTLNG